MSRKVKLGLLFIIGYLVCLAVMLPLAPLVRYLPLPFELESPTGTLWDGGAGKISWQNVDLYEVHWKLDAPSLLKGKAKVNIYFGQGADVSGRGIVSLSPWGEWQTENVRLNLPVTWLMERQPMSLPVDIDGEVHLKLPNATSGQPWCETIDGELQWLDGELVTPVGVITPDYPLIAKLSCKAGQPRFTIDHPDSQMDLQVEGMLKADGWQLKGTIKAGEEMEPNIANSLQYVGAPAGEDDVYQLDFAGDFKKKK